MKLEMWWLHIGPGWPLTIVWKIIYELQIFRLYALQMGLKISTHQQEETKLLLALMDWLEVVKKENHENEAITNEVAAQAHLENYALKLFLYADKCDREANFGK